MTKENEIAMIESSIDFWIDKTKAEFKQYEKDIEKDPTDMINAISSLYEDMMELKELIV